MRGVSIARRGRPGYLVCPGINRRHKLRNQSMSVAEIRSQLAERYGNAMRAHKRYAAHCKHRNFREFQPYSRWRSREPRVRRWHTANESCVSEENRRHEENEQHGEKQPSPSHGATADGAGHRADRPTAGARPCASAIPVNAGAGSSDRSSAPARQCRSASGARSSAPCRAASLPIATANQPCARSRTEP